MVWWCYDFAQPSAWWLKFIDKKTMVVFSANEKWADVMDYPIMKHL